MLDKIKQAFSNGRHNIRTYKRSYLLLCYSIVGFNIARNHTDFIRELQHLKATTPPQVFSNYKIKKHENFIELAKGKFEVYDVRTNEIVASKDFGFFGNIMPWLTFYNSTIILYICLNLRKGFFKEYISKEKRKKTLIISSTAGLACFYLTTKLGSDLALTDKLHLAYNFTAETVARTYSFLKKRNLKEVFSEAKKRNDQNYMPCRYLNFIDSVKEARRNLKQENYSVALENMLKAIKLERDFDQDVSYYVNDSLGGKHNLEREFFHRLLTFFSSDFSTYSNQIIKDIITFSPFLKYDISRAIRKCPEESLEFRVLGAEFTVDEQESQKQWSDIYRLLIERDNLQPVGLKTKNTVTVMDSKILKKHYVFKQKSKQDLESEVQQTNFLNEQVFRHISNVETVEITSSLYYPLIEREDIGVGIFNYVDGIHLSELLRVSSEQDRISLLERAVDINSSTAYYGINKSEINRLQKTKLEIQKLSLTKKKEEELLKSIDVLFKYTENFFSVYDCDGHSDNIIVKQEGDSLILIPIDIEARLQADSSYMLVKLLEYKSVLPYDSRGIQLRGDLIQRHFSNIGENQPKDIQEAHYYSSVPLKFISYLILDIQGDAIKEVLETYRKSSLFALDTLIENYSRNYSQQEIDKLRTISSLIELM